MLDRYDLVMRLALQPEARLSNAELATRIGLRAPPTRRRVRWLEEQGNVKDVHTRRSLSEVKVGAGLPLGHLAAPSSP